MFRVYGLGFVLGFRVKGFKKFGGLLSESLYGRRFKGLITRFRDQRGLGCRGF